MKIKKRLALFSLVFILMFTIMLNSSVFAKGMGRTVHFEASQILTQEEFVKELEALKDKKFYENEDIKSEKYINRLLSNPITSAVTSTKSSYIGSYVESGLTHYIKSYNASGVTTNKFKYYLGGSTFINNSGYPATVMYVQSATTTKTASFSVGAEASATVKGLVMQAAATISTSVTESYTFAQGTTISGSVVIDPGDSVDMTAYMRGVNVGGSLIEDIFLNSGGYFIAYDVSTSTGDRVVDPSWLTLVIG